MAPRKAILKSLPPWSYLVIAVTAISVSIILVRFSGTPPLAIAFYRQLFCAVLILPWFQRTAFTTINSVDNESQLRLKDKLLLGFSGLFLALHFAAWITGVFLTTVARATLLVDLQPIWASILAALFLKEKMSAAEVLGVLAVTAGGCITVIGGITSGGETLIGDLLALAGGISGAAYLLIGRSVRSRIPWIRYMFFIYAISAAFLLLFHFALFKARPLLLQRDFFLVLFMAAGPGILGHGLLNYSLKYYKTYVVNSALLGEPVLATIMGVFFFAEIPDLYFYAGAVLVFAGLGWIFFINSRLECNHQIPKTRRSQI